MEQPKNNLLFELLDEVLEQRVVKVFTAEQRVTIGWLHLKDSFLNLQYGYVKRATSKVIHRNSTTNIYTLDNYENKTRFGLT